MATKTPLPYAIEIAPDEFGPVLAVHVVPILLAGYGADATDVPAELVAVAVKVYEPPVVRPMTVQLFPAEVHVWPPDEVTV